MKSTVIRFLVFLIAASISLSCSSSTETSNEVNISTVKNTTPPPAPSLQATRAPSQVNANKTGKAQDVSQVDIAGVSVSVGQDAHISQDRLVLSIA